MKSTLTYLSFLLLFPLFMMNSCSASNGDKDEEIPVVTTRIITFSGYEWVVRTTKDDKQGPGPNFFSDSEENVWVDNDGKLHLKVVQRDGIWYCAGITLRQTQGHKKYVFYLSSRVDQLDENVVAGLFTYKNDEEEIDIEFSRWSDTENQNSQFAIQPSYVAGNKTRYDMNLDSNLTTHFFDWQADKIDFGSYEGHTLEPETNAIINTWTYTGEAIPPLNDERLKINLWLFRGNGPTDNKAAEMIIDRIEIL
ncbi:glycoside hydrolase family 16 protein [Aureibaculum luteum]|uniref:glycoside hydrolase family 16 protein n=1 Tax=Aureibaculum luteum TaxID=1548456 RepID=UPI000E53EE76|nr:glycoside hydrolase family 16 protein [Aureibaculum luteum]